MKLYTICKTTDSEYDGFLLCLTSESLIDFLDCIEAEPLISHSNGTLLIDQLLITGNGRNRYVSFNYIDGKINMSSAKTVFPSEKFRKLSIDMLKRNYALLHNSILTFYQKESIKKGIVF